MNANVFVARVRPFVATTLRVVRGMQRAVLPALLVTIGSGSLLAQPGVISGRIIHYQTKEGLDRVRVSLVGTQIGAFTNVDGQYTIRGVPAGPHSVRAARVGFSEQKKSVTVSSGQTTSVDFAMSPVALELMPVMTTATGPQRREEIGNSVSQINVATLAKEAPIRSVDDLINSRSPGVVVQTGTQTGTGSRVRIRGQSSLNLGNDPIYIIDGIRMTSDIGSNRYGTGGGNASRTGDINPQDIENIEIVKGPSAATLYGTDAANGVILITTKRGRSGGARWSVFTEGGVLSDRNTYPDNYTIAGHSPATPGVYREDCTLPTVSSGACVKDSIRIYAPLHDPDATPIGRGNRMQGGVQVTGGTEAVRYFVSADRESETGTLKLPNFELQRYDTTPTLVLHDYTVRPNYLGKNNVRMNLDAAVHPKLDLSLSSGFTNLAQRYSLESNATAGLGSHVFGGPGYVGNCNVAVVPATPCHGYRAWTPGYTWSEKTAQGVNRFIIGMDANWRPASWNVTRFTVGNDLTDRVDEDFRGNGEGPPLNSTYRDGFKGIGHTNVRNSTVNAISSANFNVRPAVGSKTTLGVQYTNYNFAQSAGEGTTLPPGGVTAATGSTQAADEATTIQKTIGVFAEELVSLNDRLYITGALRSDQNSAFGSNFQRVVYPKASVAWVLSDEPFFPRPNWLNQLRLRTAYGASGVQPGPNDALRSYDANRVSVLGVDVPSIRADRIGNLDLKPERTTELEGGFESVMLGTRFTIDFTGYYKRTKDALIAAVVAPSLGTGVTTLRSNLGAVENKGLEVLARMQLLDRPQFAWDMSINGSTNANKLISLGGTPAQILTERRVVEGYPLFGWWAKEITGWQDKNNDGILTYNADPNLNEVFVADSATFRGYTQPRHNVTLTNGFDLLSRRVLRLNMVLDYRGGYKAYNNTERIRCVSRQNCNGLKNPNASFEEQAMVVATRDHPARTLDGFFQDGTFIKLRELSVRYSLPATLSDMMRSRSADLVLSARNVAKWTRFRGIDPENDYLVTGGGDAPADFQTIGPASYWTVRLNLGF